MSYNIGYFEALKGTNYKSFQISIGGPTLFQGSDSSVFENVKNGDVWIKTGVSPSILQYNGNWQALGGGGESEADVQALISAYVAQSVSNGDIANAIVASQPKDNAVLHVSNSVGGSYVADGTVFRPYKTIQAAVDYANSSISAGTSVVVQVHAGSFQGFTLTRPKTSIVGLAQGRSLATQITTPITVSPYAVVNGDVNNLFTLENMQIATSGTPLTLTGSYTQVFYGTNLKLFTTTANAAALMINPSTNITFKIADSNINNISSNIHTIYVANAAQGSGIYDTEVYGGAAPSLRHHSGYADYDHIFIGSQSGTSVVVEGGTFNMARSTVFNEGANSNGISFGTGSTSLVFSSLFNVPSGTGYCFTGGPAATVLHAQNTFVANNKMSNALTSIAMSTSPTVV